MVQVIDFSPECKLKLPFLLKRVANCNRIIAMNVPIEPYNCVKCEIFQRGGEFKICGL